MMKHLISKIGIKEYLFVCLLVMFFADFILLWQIEKNYTPSAEGEMYCVLPLGNSTLADRFTHEKVKVLQEKYADYDLSYYYIQDENVQNMGKSKNVHVVATTNHYAQMVSLWMKQGSFFDGENQVSPRIVIDEQAAYDLWGTTDCLGETLIYDANAWKIVGIACNQEKDEKIGYIYLLGNDLEKEVNIENLWVKCSEPLASQNRTIIKQMLMESGHEISHYQIFCASQYQEQISSYRRLLFLGIGMVVLISLLLVIIRQLEKEYKVLKEAKKKNYIIDYLKAHSVEFIRKLILILVGMSGVLAGLQMLSSKLMSYICNREKIDALAYHLPSEIHRLSIENILGKMACILGLILFIGMIQLGYSMIRRKQ